MISTPLNATVYGEGGLRQNDLLVPGLSLMILGCLLISETGPVVLGWMGFHEGQAGWAPLDAIFWFVLNA